MSEQGSNPQERSADASSDSKEVPPTQIVFTPAMLESLANKMLPMINASVTKTVRSMVGDLENSNRTRTYVQAVEVPDDRPEELGDDRISLHPQSVVQSEHDSRPPTRPLSTTSYRTMEMQPPSKKAKSAAGMVNPSLIAGKDTCSG